MLRRVINPFLFLPIALSINSINVLSSEAENNIDNTLGENSNKLIINYEEIEKIILKNQELKSLQNLVNSANFNVLSKLGQIYPSLDLQVNGLPKYVSGRNYSNNSPTLETSQFSVNPSLNIK